MHTRRQLLQGSTAWAAALAGLGLLPAQSAQAAWNTASFDAKTLPEVMKALGLAAPVESKDVTLSAPDIAENGAVVPLGAACAAAGLKRLALLVEKNPNMLAAVFELSDALEPTIGTRVKMSQTSSVLAVAVTTDGRVLYAHKEVKVTIGGCGG